MNTSAPAAASFDHGLHQLLDQTVTALHRGNLDGALRELSTHLWQLRLNESADRWAGLIKPACDTHPLMQIVLEDPCTRRAREKPRGYAGDAELIDYIYTQVAPRGTTELGSRVFRYTTNAPSGHAVRWRLRYLADCLDETVARKPRSRALSLACGHLREAGLSQAVRDGRVSALVGIDQDPESLAVVRRDYGHLPAVRIAEGSVRQILRSGLTEGDFDLAYAAGLYDYLDDGTAQALTARLFDALAPNGRLIVPNFLSTNYARGYMESFMEWNLIVRDRAAIEAIGAGLPDPLVAERRYFEDPHAVVGYLEVVKRA